MFTVVYRFKIKPKSKKSFINSWLNMTLYLKNHRSGLGSRLHEIDKDSFFAYAQWPNKKAWEEQRKDLSNESEMLSKEMKKSLLTSETVFYGELLVDELTL